MDPQGKIAEHLAIVDKIKVAQSLGILFGGVLVLEFLKSEKSGLAIYYRTLTKQRENVLNGALRTLSPLYCLRLWSSLAMFVSHNAPYSGSSLFFLINFLIALMTPKEQQKDFN